MSIVKARTRKPAASSSSSSSSSSETSEDSSSETSSHVPQGRSRGQERRSRSRHRAQSRQSRQQESGAKLQDRSGGSKSKKRPDGNDGEPVGHHEAAYQYDVWPHLGFQKRASPAGEGCSRKGASPRRGPRPTIKEEPHSRSGGTDVCDVEEKIDPMGPNAILASGSRRTVAHIPFAQYVVTNTDSIGGLEELFMSVPGWHVIAIVLHKCKPAVAEEVNRVMERVCRDRPNYQCEQWSQALWFVVRLEWVVAITNAAQLSYDNDLTYDAVSITCQKNHRPSFCVTVAVCREWPTHTVKKDKRDEFWEFVARSIITDKVRILAGVFGCSPHTVERMCERTGAKGGRPFCQLWNLSQWRRRPRSPTHILKNWRHAAETPCKELWNYQHEEDADGVFSFPAYVFVFGHIKAGCMSN